MYVAPFFVGRAPFLAGRAPFLAGRASASAAGRPRARGAADLAARAP